MKLKSGLSFWLLRDGIPFWYDTLDRDISTDVLILGGGISGALIAYTLTNSGIDCIVVDRRLIGMGSTSASTSLLQYEIDLPLIRLIEKVGEKEAVRAYTMCRQAVGKLLKIGEDIGFGEISKKRSLYFAADEKDADLLYEEFRCRKKYGFDVAYLDEKEIRDLYGLASYAGILSECAAATDAYLFTHSLFQDSEAKGLKIFCQTGVTNIDVSADHIVAHTEQGIKIKAGKVIYAVGYEGLKYINKGFGEIHTTYALAASSAIPLDSSVKDAVFWNTAHPYFYMRCSAENNLLIGGRDDLFFEPEIMQQSIGQKSKELLDDFNHMFPECQLIFESGWAGLFVTTKDGLPFIGRYRGLPNSYFALGYGGNGITFSIIAAEIMRDLILGRKNDDAAIFSFSRG